MAKFPGPFDFSNLTTVPQLSQYVTILAKQLQSGLGGNLNFSDNFKSSMVTQGFPTLSTNVQVPHGLGIVPQGYIVVRLSAAAIIYDGNPVSIGASTINLSSSVSGVTATLLFF